MMKTNLHALAIVCLGCGCCLLTPALGPVVTSGIFMAAIGTIRYGEALGEDR